VVTISRAGPAFSTKELLLAGHLQPVLAGIWPLKRPRPDGTESVAAGCEGLPSRCRKMPSCHPVRGRSAWMSRRVPGLVRAYEGVRPCSGKRRGTWCRCVT
jgi:hypothetical protein